MSTHSLPSNLPHDGRQGQQVASEKRANVLSPDASDDLEARPRYLSVWRTVVIVLSLCAGTLLVAIDTTIISVAIPRIATEFVAFSDVGWYGSAYLFTVTAFQPGFGSVYRFFDAKWTYLLSVILFEVGSVLCAAAPVSAVFIFGRSIQGVGAAGLYQGALAIIGLTIPLKQRPMMIGIVLSVFGLAVCFGPPVGGVFTDQVTWRWCFWINLPIGAATFMALLVFLKLPKSYGKRDLSFRQKMAMLDFPGIILIIGAVCCLVLALQWGGQDKPWNSSDVIGLIVGAALLLIAFGLVQWREAEKATIPLRIFRQRSIFMGAWYLFFLEMSIYAYLFYLPFYFQSAQLLDAQDSGIRAIPLGLSQIVAVVICSYLVTRFGHYVPFMVLGPLVAIIGNVFLTRIAVDTRTALWATYLVVTGIGTGMGLQIPFTGVQMVLEKDDVPVGNAIVSFLQQLGAAISVAVAQSIFSSGLRAKLQDLNSPIRADIVMAAGPTGIRTLTSDAALVRLIQEAYCEAFQNTMYYALAGLVVSIPLAGGMQWLNA
ncbi:efflux pump antibiotic resistance protein [Biscogniauxia mediterranea]|nr:efflux pump antibiotic resistance protein [Biscogniauxia mediterranea]